MWKNERYNNYGIIIMRIQNRARCPMEIGKIGRPVTSNAAEVFKRGHG